MNRTLLKSKLRCEFSAVKKLLLPLVFTCFAIVCSGQTLTEKRTVSNFTGIDASSAFKITVTKGNTESLTIEADEKVMPYVRSEVKNGMLKLYLDNDRSIRNIKKLEAVITIKELDKVRLSGACSITSNDLFTPAKFSAGLSGATKLNLKIQTGALNFDVSGASKVTMNAKVTGNAIFDISGSSNMALELVAAKTTFDISGASKIELRGKSESANFDLSGVSNIKAAGFEVKSAYVDASGAGSVEIAVSESLKTSLSGAAKVYYKGRPSNISVNNSGGSSVKQLE